MGRKKVISDEQVLAIARDMFTEHGHTVSTKDIALAAGVSESTLFQRFDTKADLFFDAMVPPAFDLTAFDAAHGCASPMESVQAMMVALVDYFRSLTPILLQLMTHPDFNFEHFAARHPDSPLVHIRLGLVGQLEQLRDQGHLSVDDPSPTALTLIATAHSLAIFERLNVHGGHFPDEVLHAIVSQLWAGIGNNN